MVLMGMLPILYVEHMCSTCCRILYYYQLLNLARSRLIGNNRGEIAPRGANGMMFKGMLLLEAANFSKGCGM